MEQRKEKLLDQTQELYEKWNGRWLAEPGSRELNIFYAMFQCVYEYTLSAKEYNKKMNFRWKVIFLFVLSGLWLFYAAILIKFIFFSHEKAQLSWVESGLSLVLLFFLSSIISKWLDIKKYQETWARYSWQQHQMEMEMIRFVSNIEPYNGVNKKQEFVKNISEIWGKNIEKFVHNMEEKEKGLMDIFDNIKTK